MKIMWLSDSCFTVTGYSTMSWNILNGLAKAGHECHLLAHNYLGQDMEPGNKIMNTPPFDFYIHGLPDRIRDLVHSYVLHSS